MIVLTIVASISIYLPHRSSVATYPAEVARTVDQSGAQPWRPTPVTPPRTRLLRAATAVQGVLVRVASRVGLAGGKWDSSLAKPLRSPSDSRSGSEDAVSDCVAVPAAAAAGRGGGVRLAEEEGESGGGGGVDRLDSDGPVGLGVNQHDRRVVILPPNVWRGATFIHPYLGSRSYIVPATAQARHHHHHHHRGVLMRGG
jgi:hypothetical protein